MRTAQSLCHSFIAVVATAGIGLGAGSSAIAAESTGSTAAASSVQSVVHAKSKRVHVKNVKLRDGSTAKIYKLGKNKMQAEIWGKGSKLGTLTANGKSAYANHNGLRVKLSCKGTVTSWMDSAKPKPKPKPQPHGKRVLVASPKLADGSTAKVYRLGKNKMQAEIWAKGSRLGTLTANGKSAYANHNGLRVKLTCKGTVTSWLDSAKPKPKPKPKPHGERVLVASPKLADGSTAKIYKLSANHYQAEFFGAGAKLGSLDANGRAAYGENNGLHVALQPDGQLSSWLDTSGQDTQQPSPDTDDVKPDPQPTPDTDDIKPDPQPTPDTDDIKPDPQPTPDSDDIKPQEQEPKPAADQAEPDALPAPVPAI